MIHILHPDPVGAENPVTSCDLHVLVYEAAESVSAQWPNGRAGASGSVARGRPRAGVDGAIGAGDACCSGPRTPAAQRRGGVVR